MSAFGRAPPHSTDQAVDPLIASLQVKPLRQGGGLHEYAQKPMAEQLSALEASLLSRNFPPMSPWWHETLKRFYSAMPPACRQLVLRVGRRGGKSSTLCRIAVLEALYGHHKVPPGDTGIVGIVSVTMGEARSRLKTIKDILTAIGVKYYDRKDTIDVTSFLGRPIRFQIYAASLSSVVGGTWICAICDEVSRWRDAESGANPAFEVLASLRPCLATMPNAKIFLSSSPLGLVDAHAKAFEEGDTDYQMVAQAPTWVANPSVSEQHTHDLEKNERVWKREYAAIPQGHLTAVFSLDDIDRCIDLGECIEPTSVGQCVMSIDPSRGHDAWTYCISQWVWHKEMAVLRIKEIGQVERATDTRASVTWLCNKAKAHGCTSVASDQYDASGLSVLFSDGGLSFYQFVWSPKTKKAAVDRLDRFLRDTEIALPDHDMMRRHLVEYSEKIGRNGGDPTYSGRGKHDDFAAVIITTIMLELDNKLPLVTAPIEQPHANEVIEKKWIEQMERRHQENIESRRDWGAATWSDHIDNLRYMP